MAEPTITCPNCKTEIKLPESLAAPLLEATRRDFEQRMKKKDLDLAAKLMAECEKIAADEARKAKLALATELDQRPRAVAELENALKENNAKLAEFDFLARLLARGTEAQGGGKGANHFLGAETKSSP